MAIFGLVAGAAGKMEDYVGCKGKYKGILKIWENLDELFKSIDQGFCSEQCKCDITQEFKSNYSSNQTLKTYFDSLKTESGNNVINFLNCSDTLLTTITENFSQYDQNNGNYLKKFNLTKFGDFWEYIETKFECTGWCQSEYTINDKNYQYLKYLSSNINNGPVKNQGCLKSILDWLPPILKAYGGIAVCCSVCGIINFILALFLLIGCYKKNDDKKKTTGDKV